MKLRFDSILPIRKPTVLLGIISALLILSLIPFIGRAFWLALVLLWYVFL